MKQPLAQETNKIDFFETSEEEILNNTKIKTCLVETNIDIYNDMARVMANKIKEGNEKEILTSFILPVGPTPSFPATFLREHKNSNITVSKNVLRGYIDF